MRANCQIPLERNQYRPGTTDGGHPARMGCAYAMMVARGHPPSSVAAVLAGPRGSVWPSASGLRAAMVLLV